MDAQERMMKTMGVRMSASLALLVSMLWGAGAAWAEPASWSPEADQEAEEGEGVEGFDLTMGTEFGFVSVLYNRIQQGRDGTYFDYVADGGQELFTPFLRLSAEALFKKRHNVIFLYQPIDLRTRVRLSDPLTVDGLTFPEGQTMDLRYGFDFYRASYTFDLFADEDVELAVGGGFQMRIASIEYVPVDGSEGRFNRDLGPVPLLKIRARKNFDSGWWLATEIDGFYANIRVLNGDLESSVTGAIADVSVRGGVELYEGLDAFLNLRYLGGGGVGDSPDDELDQPGDGYTKNWLHAATISLGFYLEPWRLVE